MSRFKMYWFCIAVLALAVMPLITTTHTHGQEGDSNTIHACVNSANGHLRIVAADDECRRNETPLSWNTQGPPGPAGGVSKVLTEINFNLAFGPSPRFLWEPGRYDPPPTEIFFEVDVAMFGGERTLRLQDVTNGVPIGGSSITTSTGGRLRTPNLVASFPTTPAEITVIVEGDAGWQPLRVAVLIQQSQ